MSSKSFVALTVSLTSHLQAKNSKYAKFHKFMFLLQIV